MYKDYIFKTKESPKKSVPKIIWKVVKILFYSFLLLSMLWGCSEMFISKYNTYQVVDSSGTSVYKTGIFFEILFDLPGLATNKIHYGHITGNTIYEYPYLSINSWSDAFQETQSPFYGFFVYPTSWLLVSIMMGLGGPINGAAVILSIFIMSVLVRIITIGFTWKTQINQQKMQILQVKQQEIKNKYAHLKNDPVAKRKQQMEIMELYKKNKQSPLASMGSMFLSFPFLFALYVTIRSTRVLKGAQVGEISLIDRPWSMITQGEWVYASLIAVYLPIQVVSMFLPTVLNLRNQENKTPEQKKARRKQFIIQGVMILVFMFVIVSVAAGVAIYWIFSGVLQIIQTLGFYYGRNWYNNKGQRIKEKARKEKEMNKAKMQKAKIIQKEEAKEAAKVIKENNENNNAAKSKTTQNNKKKKNNKKKSFTL